MHVLANRENFWAWATINTFALLSQVVFFRVIYQGTVSINGWTQFQTLLVLGVGSLIGVIGSLTFFPFMYGFGKDIIEGDLDMRLVKPLDVHFQSSFCWVDFEDIINLPNSILLIIYSLLKLQTAFGIINLVGFIVLLISSLVILFSVLTLIQSLAFKLIKVDSVSSFYWSIIGTTRYPAKAIRGISKIGAWLLVPAAIISTVPAEILFGRWDIVWILGSIVTASTLFVFSRWVFMSSLRHYSSASS